MGCRREVNYLFLSMQARPLSWIFGVFLTGVLLFNVVSVSTVLGIGQSTDPIVFKNVLRGETVTSVLNLSNSEENSVLFEFESSGDIDGWATFYKSDDTEFSNPVTAVEALAKTNLRAYVKFTIPDDAANGTYDGEVAILVAPIATETAEGDSSVDVFQRVGRAVRITVSDEEAIDLGGTVVPSSYVVASGGLLDVKVIYENKGNVSLKPDIQLKVSKDSKTIFTATYPYPEGEVAVKPTEQKIFPSLIQWSTAGQADGQYRAEFKVMVNGQVYHEESFRFNIGSVFLGGLLAFMGGAGTGGWLIGLGVLLLVLSVILSSKKRRKNTLKIFTQAAARIKGLF